MVEISVAEYILNIYLEHLKKIYLEYVFKKVYIEYFWDNLCVLNVYS